jgi:hypothetical protein
VKFSLFPVPLYFSLVLRVYLSDLVMYLEGIVLELNINRPF